MHCMNEMYDPDYCDQCGGNGQVDTSLPNQLVPGTILNEKYLIGAALGAGGFGITYIAKDLKLNLKLAIKEYFPQDLAFRTGKNADISSYSGELAIQYEDGLKRFLKEARILAKFVEHPGIVNVRDYFEANETAYMVMNYMEGITLKEYLLDKGGKLHWETAITLMMPVMDALHAVHKHGILHRDISPENIYITRDGQAKLLDFGAARNVSTEGMSLSILLKPGYAPEEQYRTRGVQGAWTDVYATAATMYRLITGTMPVESLERILKDDLPKPTEMMIDLPQNIETIILKAMAVSAEERYQTVKEFQEAVMAALEDIETSKVIMEGDENSQNQEEEHTEIQSDGSWIPLNWNRRRFWTAAMTVVALMIILAGMGRSQQKVEVQSEQAGIENTTENTIQNETGETSEEELESLLGNYEEVERKEADLTGDGRKETVIVLAGESLMDQTYNGFIVEILDGNRVMEQIEINGGHLDDFSVGDTTHDGKKEVFIAIHSGGSMGRDAHYLFSYQDHQLVDLVENFEPKLSVEFQDDFEVVIRYEGLDQVEKLYIDSFEEKQRYQDVGFYSGNRVVEKDIGGTRWFNLGINPMEPIGSQDNVFNMAFWTTAVADHSFHIFAGVAVYYEWDGNEWIPKEMNVNVTDDSGVVHHYDRVTEERKFDRDDLYFSGMNIGEDNIAEFINRFGQPIQTSEYHETEGMDAYHSISMTYDGFEAKFIKYTDFGQDEHYLNNIEIFSQILSGPRGIKVGDTVRKTLTHFPSDLNRPIRSVGSDSYVQTIYGEEYDHNGKIWYNTQKEMKSIDLLYYVDTSYGMWLTFKIRNNQVERIICSIP